MTARIRCIEDVEYNNVRDAVRDVCRLHYVTEDVCGVVKHDLETRYGPQRVKNTNYLGKPYSAKYHFDFGGMSHGSWEPHELVLDEYTFSFWAHQADLLEAALTIRSSSGPGYVKAYCWQSLFCSTPARFAALVELLDQHAKEIEEHADREMRVMDAVRKELHAKGALAYKD